MPKNWKLKPKAPEDFFKEHQELGEVGAQLLYNRGLTEQPAIDAFLNAKYEDLHDPFLFADMQKAVERIWQAINQGEQICIYGDYDADAVTANAVLQQAFAFLNIKVGSYIPDRFTEGYGVNLEALAKMKEGGCKVIITVDCGTNSTEAADWCAENGIDFIITDHHEVIGELPKAYALINPKNPADKYPYHELTGVGVAFKVACAILTQREKIDQYSHNVGADTIRPYESGKIISSPTSPIPDGMEKWLLDLVAIGTVADCHSLIGENRILVKFGLRVLTKTRWPGLRALINVSELDFNQKPPDTYTLGFILAPRLNAAGRLEHADTALHLLTEKDPISALERAQALDIINQRRQQQTERIMSEAREAVEQVKSRKVLAIMGEGWNKGIVGLVAGKIAEEFYKPTIVLSREGDTATGSARTAGEFNVVEALKHSSEFLEKFGGHNQAAGLTLKPLNFENFYQKVLEFAEENIADGLERSLELEAELDPGQLSIVTCQLLQRFEPFGIGNPRPKFLIGRLKIASQRMVGSAGQHMQCLFEAGGKKIASIMFNCGDFAKSLKVGDTVDAAAEVMEDTWNGRKEIKLRIIDIRKLGNIEIG